MIKNERKTLRGKILAQRSKLSPAAQNYASTIIARNLYNSSLFMRSQRIAFYWPNKREVDTRLLLDQALLLGKDCYLPILQPLKHNQLWFGRYQTDHELHYNSLKILEPNPKSTVIIPAWTLDLVITPLVAFDQQGNRLGMGGGFYDRTFEFLIQKQSRRPFLLGVGYDFQCVAKIQPRAWDVELNAVFTEKKNYYFSLT